MTLVDLYTPLYIDPMFVADTGIAHVETSLSSRIMVDSFKDHQIDLLPHQAVPNASMHHEKVVHSHMSHAKMLVLIPLDSMEISNKTR